MIYTRMQELSGRMDLTPAEEAGLERILADFPMRIPEYYLKLIDFSDPRIPSG